jgi:hypothetical protein
MTNTTQVPPDVARYLQGPPPEGRQFDFLIGDWAVSATRYGENGVALFQYKATWQAKSVDDGRMIVDDFKALSPTWQAISCYVTLRTYSPLNRRWEMVGLASLQPAVSGEWYGEWRDGEMLTHSSGTDGAGKRIKVDIRFFNIAQDRFEWESRLSGNDGQSWIRAASLVALRVG